MCIPVSGQDLHLSCTINIKPVRAQDKQQPCSAPPAPAPSPLLFSNTRGFTWPQHSPGKLGYEEWSSSMCCLNPREQLSSHSGSLNQPHRCLPEALPTLHIGKGWGSNQPGQAGCRNQAWVYKGRTGCNWKDQFIRETSHCREFTTHWKGSSPAGAATLQQLRSMPPAPTPAGTPKGRVNWNTAYVYKQPERARIKVQIKPPR